MTAVDLLPCPICGNPDVAVSSVNGRVFCETCGTEGPWSPYFDGDWNHRAPVSAATLEAAPQVAAPAPQVAPVSAGKVKALEWEDLGADYWRTSAPLFGSIRIEPWGDRGFNVLWSAPGICDRLINELFNSPEAAKASAEARILSALVPGDGWQGIEALIDVLHCCDVEAHEISMRISGKRGQPCQHPDGVRVLEDAETIIRAAATVLYGYAPPVPQINREEG